MTINFAIHLLGNPTSVVIRSMTAINAEGETVYEKAQTVTGGTFTPPVAAYQCLIAVLKWARSNSAESTTIFTDQELLTEQISGRWECRNERLQPLRRRATELLRETDAHLEYVPASRNTKARLLCVLLANQLRQEGRAQTA
jgi:ribonuclease HI